MLMPMHPRGDLDGEGRGEEVGAWKMVEADGGEVASGTGLGVCEGPTRTGLCAGDLETEGNGVGGTGVGCFVGV